MKKIAVIGIGNPLRKDDGIGIFLLDEIKKKKNIFPHKIELFDGGTGGLNLIHLFSNYDIVVFIDAMNLKGGTGASRFFKYEDLKLTNSNECHSSHSLDLINIIKISKKMNHNSPDFYFFGIQPKDISFGMDISKELQEKIDSMMENLVNNVNKLINYN